MSFNVSNLIEAASNPFNHRIRLTIFSILRPPPSTTHRTHTNNHPKIHMLTDKTKPNTKRSLSMLSERTVTIRSHTPQTALMKRFNKKTTKKEKPDSLTSSNLHRKKASHTHLPTSTQKIKVNVNADATQFLTPTPSPQHRPIQQIPAAPS